MARSLKETLDTIGLAWVTVLLAALMSSLIYLIPSLWQTWTHNGPNLISAGGFVTGHDFVAFYAASQAVLQGDAALVYDQAYMWAAQAEVVGATNIGYLAFMYPPTYLLVTSPLATLPYFAALAVWQVVPLAIFLLLLRRIPMPPLALLLAAGAPAVAQALFAGQNGLPLAIFLGGGMLALGGGRQITAGILLALATMKPQLALLIVPALMAGMYWRALGAMAVTFAVLAILSVVFLGMEVWLNYLAVPGQVSAHMAQGLLPWSRMPTIYTAAKQAGLPDGAAGFLQLAGAAAAVAGVMWGWRQSAGPGMKAALLLAGAPLATPFMYDYDLPFMVFALAFYLAGASGRDIGSLERVLLLLVWLQPAWWWWQAVERTGVSPSPIVYGLFFGVILYRIGRGAGDGPVAPAKG